LLLFLNYSLNTIRMTISNSHKYLLNQVMAADADEWRSLSTESTPMLKKKGRQSITTYNVLLLFMLSIFMFMTGTSFLDCLQNTRLRSLALALSVLLFLCYVVYLLVARSCNRNNRLCLQSI